MGRIAGGILVLVLGLSVAAAQDEGRGRSTTPVVEQYDALLKEFQEAAHGFWKAETDEERNKAVARVDPLPLKFLVLAEQHPQDPIALDALTQVVLQEIWLENNTTHAGWGKDSPEARAIALLLRDHVQSDKLSDTCRRLSFGFREECETFLRTVLEMNPHKDVQALACLRLAQFLNHRLHRLDLVKERPELAERYEGLFGKEYLDELQRRDRDEAVKEVESVFELAAAEYGDVEIPFGSTVGEVAKSELFAIRHLAVGREAQDIEGVDQDGRRFKLSDYRGKVVLLYFWSEF